MAFDVVRLILNVVFVVNLLFGMAGWFSGQLVDQGYAQVNYSGVSININQSNYEETAEQLEANPIIEATGGVMGNLRTALLGVPTVTRNILYIANAPDSLVDLIYYALLGLVALAYIVFGLQVWSYLHGGG